MFLAWLIRNDYASQELIEEPKPKEIELLKSQKLSGAQFLLRVLDEKFTNQELNEEGNAFAVAITEARTTTTGLWMTISRSSVSTNRPCMA
jgi:hypothetical protein